MSEVFRVRQQDRGMDWSLAERPKEWQERCIIAVCHFSLDKHVLATVKEQGMGSWDSIKLWTKRLYLGVYWSQAPGSDWPKGPPCPAYTDQRVQEMIKAGDLVVTGGSGVSRDQAVILRGVPGMLAGREIAIILSQDMVGQPASAWLSKKVEHLPNLEDDPHHIYKVLAGLPDRSVREVWFDIYHRPSRIPS